METKGVFYIPDVTPENTTFECVGGHENKQQTETLLNNDIEKSESLGKRIWNSFGPCIILVALFFIVFKGIIMNGIIPSSSMEPTLAVGDYVVANRLAYSFESVKTGDIVVVDSKELGKLIIKRVIGLPGDTIDIKNGIVYVNQIAIEEAYAFGTTTESLNQVTHFEVPENSLFLLGDNRENSNDSRWWNNPYVELNDVKGKAVLEFSIGGDNGFFVELIKN